MGTCQCYHCVLSLVFSVSEFSTTTTTSPIFCRPSRVHKYSITSWETPQWHLVNFLLCTDVTLYTSSYLWQGFTSCTGLYKCAEVISWSYFKLSHKGILHLHFIMARAHNAIRSLHIFAEYEVELTMYKCYTYSVLSNTCHRFDNVARNFVYQTISSETQQGPTALEDQCVKFTAQLSSICECPRGWVNSNTYCLSGWLESCSTVLV